MSTIGGDDKPKDDGPVARMSTPKPLRSPSQPTPQEDRRLLDDPTTSPLQPPFPRPSSVPPPDRPSSSNMNPDLNPALESVESPQSRLTPGPSSDPAAVGTPGRRLDVTDALSYLDAVKVQFHDRTDVYNRFLDIMKDFKQQQIDTPGVIDRVSNLFRGHPALIEGFNTFLPAGYRIECTTDASNPDLITITTPSGTTTQAIRGSVASDLLNSDTLPNPQSHPHTRLQSNGQQGIGGLDLDFPNTGIDLELALRYVQKVRSRYANDPERFKAFLEILSQGTPMSEEEVVNGVSRLFKDDEDLMKGFYDFLPDRNVQLQAAAKADEIDDAHRAGSSALTDGRHAKRKDAPSSNQRGAAGSGTPSNVPQKRKRKPIEKDKDKDRERMSGDISRGEDRDIPLSQLSRAGASKVKRAKQGHHPIPTSSTRDSEAPSPALVNRSAVAVASPRGVAALAHSHQFAQGTPGSLPTPVGIQHPHQALATQHDPTRFFTRVKHQLDSPSSYAEFLKLINLFTQDMIDLSRLVRESRTYLGENTELMVEWKDILGWDERRDRYAIVVEEVWTRPQGVLERSSREILNRRYGSYRKLPAGEVNVPCTGRDEMCKSVLNDEWVAQPTFTSEDTGFLAHKKNAYEDALHRSEEERHEYDFHIEAIHRTIQMLEPFANKISSLSPEERATYKLKPSLGGAAKSIHLRVVKKVYGREAGVEVFQALQDVPAVSIPLVLARLKQKHEEWKRAQREWNKVWREVDARNYAKSLDHQSITFKAYDKKALTARTFLSQIEAARDEQRARRAALIDPLFGRGRPRHQLEFVVGDASVLQDALKLVCSFLDRATGQITATERRKVESFLRTFVPLLFMLDGTTFNGGVTPQNMDSNDSYEPDSIMEESNAANGARRGNKKGVNGSAGDLRKRLLKAEQAKSSRRTRAQDAVSPAGSRPASPVPMQVDENELAKGTELVDGLGVTEDQKMSRKGTFFTNTHFYVLFRLLEVLYARLHIFKSLSNKIACDPSAMTRPNPINPSNPINPNPSTDNPISHLTDASSQLGILTDVSKLGTRSSSAVHFYDLMLESVEKLFGGEMEVPVFEDAMRWMFGFQDAYRLFTIDKVVGAVVKQVQTIVADGKSQELFDLLRRDRDVAAPTTQDLINSRRNAEKVLGPDENLFRIDLHPEPKTVTIQLLGKDDSSFDDTEVLTGRWQAYIDSYVSPQETQGLASSHARNPFLKRTRKRIDDNSLTAARSAGSLAMRVCVRTYRLFYVAHTEEALWRRHSAEDYSRAKEAVEKSTARRMEWLEGFLKRDDDPAPKAQEEAEQEKNEKEAISTTPPKL